MTPTIPTPLIRPAELREGVRNRAAWALGGLVRTVLARHWAVRLARFVAWTMALAAGGLLTVAAPGSTPDDPVLALLARSAGAIALVAGGIGALALSATPKDHAHAWSIRALAQAHWLADAQFARAELLATLRILAEIVALPVGALALFVFGVIGRAQPGAWVMTLLGSALFGIFAAVVLAALATACRRWGALAGRRWFAASVLLPWVLAPALLGERAGDWLSVPGMLAQVWRALTAVSS